MIYSLIKFRSDHERYFCPPIHCVTCAKKNRKYNFLSFITYLASFILVSMALCGGYFLLCRWFFFIGLCKKLYAHEWSGSLLVVLICCLIYPSNYSVGEINKLIWIEVEPAGCVRGGFKITLNSVLIILPFWNYFRLIFFWFWWPYNMISNAMKFIIHNTLSAKKHNSIWIIKQIML